MQCRRAWLLVNHSVGKCDETGARPTELGRNGQIQGRIRGACRSSEGFAGGRSGGWKPDHHVDVMPRVARASTHRCPGLLAFEGLPSWRAVLRGWAMPGSCRLFFRSVVTRAALLRRQMRRNVRCNMRRSSPSPVSRDIYVAISTTSGNE
jgi:hypothetical protein